MTTTISNRGFATLKLLLHGASADRAVKLSGVTLRGLSSRGFIAKDHRDRIYVTKEGLDAYNFYVSLPVSTLEVKQRTYNDVQRRRKILGLIRKLRAQQGRAA